MLQNLISLVLKVISYDTHDGNCRRESLVSLSCDKFETALDENGNPKRLVVFLGEEIKSLAVTRKTGDSCYSRTLEVTIASASLVSKEFTVEKFKGDFKEVQKKIETCF